MTGKFEIKAKVLTEQRSELNLVDRVYFYFNQRRKCVLLENLSFSSTCFVPNKTAIFVTLGALIIESGLRAERM